MKKFFLLGLMVCIIGMTNGFAQNDVSANHQSRVTDEMALKIANTAQHDYRRLVRDRTATFFCRANRITSMMEYDRIMEDIIHHKDKVENFICYLFDYYGTGDMGYDALKTYGFKVAEYDIAIEIYGKRNELREREKAEKAEQLRLRQIEGDRKTLDNWNKNGKDTLYAGQTGITAPRLLFNYGGEGIFIEPEDRQENDTKSGRRNEYAQVEASPIYVFIVGENNEVTYVDRDKWASDFNWSESDNTFEALAPGSIYLNGIDTTVIIPTSNTYQVITRYHKIRPVLSYGDTIHEGIIVRDKKGNCKFENEYPLRMWFKQYFNNAVGISEFRGEKLGFTKEEEDSFIEWMIYDLCEQLATVQGKKFKITFKIKGASVTTEYVNNQEINSHSFRCTAILISSEKK